jgi:uncharacterized membrane protein
MRERLKGPGVRSAFGPLFLLWLAAHAVLLAVLLGAKFLFTKTVIIALLVVAGAVFIFSRIRTLPRKLTHSPVV